MVGRTRDASPDAVAEGVARAARNARLDVISAVQGDRLVVAIDGVSDALAAATSMAGQFAAGPVVVGPVVTDLTTASLSASEAMAALRASVAWPAAPRPVSSDQLLPERALGRRRGGPAPSWSSRATRRCGSGGDLLETVSAYLEVLGSIEGTARALFVHPNTVRYRLRRVAEITGFVPTEARGAFALRVALTCGRLDEVGGNLQL